jgi:hypothetical protein
MAKGRKAQGAAMFPYQTRLELERLARLVGYEPERDDTDADLILAIRLRGGRA